MQGVVRLVRSELKWARGEGFFFAYQCLTSFQAFISQFVNMEICFMFLLWNTVILSRFKIELENSVFVYSKINTATGIAQLELP